jgi:hypothetical protein
MRNVVAAAMPGRLNASAASAGKIHPRLRNPPRLLAKLVVSISFALSFALRQISAFTH